MLPSGRVLTDAQMDQLAEALRGTVDSLETGLQSLFELEQNDILIEDHQALDDRVFLCDGCGWWCEMDEANDAADGQSQVCEDCNEEKTPC